MTVYEKAYSEENRLYSQCLPFSKEAMQTSVAFLVGFPPRLYLNPYNNNLSKRQLNFIMIMTMMTMTMIISSLGQER